MREGGGVWGCAEISCMYQIPYVNRANCPVDGAALEEEIGDNIWKGDRARKFEVMRHGRSFFQYIIGAKEIIKSFMQRGEDA